MNAAPARLRLKQPSGWFAAGREFDRAARLLSDAAFKVFVWLCLHAERSTGGLDICAAELAVVIGKDAREVERSIDQLIEAGVCYRRDGGRLQIRDEFWPYERPQIDDEVTWSAYIDEVRTMMRQYQCVRCTFTSADQKLAMQWCRDGILLDTVERAILLGVVRKYVALLNRGGGSPITTLHYFTDLVGQVTQLSSSPDYWTHLRRRLHQLQRHWIAQRHVRQAETK